ncbi:Crp/Fnr family transcriptional regulator [Emticicia agri]|uniref:Crp/Fnr family transcriptional regulator n=2 Tax=Emticicia agri TaxID=2492393 RepID=A0A4V1ZCY7_9BACT|nr:Crp/Fnr family transcriptional regulator [Emticicia agri]
MKEKVVSYFSAIQTLSADEAKAIADSAVIKKYCKGDFLVREGQYASDTFFVLEGLVRQYNLIDGEEKTTAFFTENQWVLSLGTADVPSKYYWICEEDCYLLIGNDQKAQNIFDQFPRLESIARKIVENAFIDYQHTINTYLTDSPEQRYIRLLESKPDLIQRIPQYQLASYIGVKPESLSRIRKRMAKNR